MLRTFLIIISLILPLSSSVFANTEADKSNTNTTNVKAAKININTAGEEELQQLDGVGPSLAKAIIEHRKQKPFSNVEDLMNVRGVGKKIFEDNKDRLTADK